MDAVYNVPPAPEAVDEQRRVEHTRLRRRLLYSMHEPDLDALLKQQLGNVRSSAWGKPDLTANPYLSLWSQVSVLYNVEPEVMTSAGSEELAALVSDAGYWPMMQRVQRDTLALREMFVRVDLDDETHTLSFRPVFPDYIEAEAHPRRPQTPVHIREWMNDATLGWVQHDLNIRNTPYYRVGDRNGHNVTAQVLGAEYEGDAYPYRDSEGTPILPYATYHAAQTGCLFDPYTLREIVEGSLNLGVLLTYYGHIVRNAAWAQRYGIGVEPAGAEVTESDGNAANSRREVVTDPAMVVLFNAQEGASNASVGTFSNPVDPEAILRSIGMYERRIQLLANVAPPDVTRQEADVRSGYSLAVAREAIREQQAVYEPQFRGGDQAMFRIAACLLNGATGATYSEVPRDYRMTYKGLPKSPIEEKLEAEMLAVEVDAKRLGPISAYMRRYPGVTYEEAVDRLARAATEEIAVATAVTEITDALGIVDAPPTSDLEVGKVQAAQAIVVAAGKREIPADAAKAMLVALVGLTDASAEAIVAPVRDAPAPSMPTPPIAPQNPPTPESRAA